MPNLLLRVLVGVVGIPLVIGIIYLGSYTFAAAIIIVSILMLREFYSLAASKHASANQSVGLLLGLIVQVLFMGSATATFFDKMTYMIGALVALIVGAAVTLTAELWRAKENAVLNTAVTAFGVVYICGGIGTLILLRAMETPPMFGYGVVLSAFVSVWVCDSIAYFAGMKFGKHKLFPRVSPKKSWEGAIAGGIAAIGAFVGMGMWLVPTLPVWHWVVCGVLVSTMGQIGDLAESLLKRDATIKDSSHILPGHGGLLDRFDSMLFVAPLLLAYFYIMFATRVL